MRRDKRTESDRKFQIAVAAAQKQREPKMKQDSHRPQTPPPGAATWEVTLSAWKVGPCVRRPASGITAHR